MLTGYLFLVGVGEGKEEEERGREGEGRKKEERKGKKSVTTLKSTKRIHGGVKIKNCPPFKKYLV